MAGFTWRERVRRVGRPSAFIAVAVLVLAVLHGAMPVDARGWQLLHLLARKLYYVPILLGAAWLSRRGAAVVAVGVSAALAVHVLREWRGMGMLQIEQLAELATYAVIATLAVVLLGRERRALEEVRTAHQDTLAALAGSLELRERYTAGHSERVRAYTLLLAGRLGIRDPRTLDLLGAGALFHDVGKIGVPDAVLLKAGPLTAEEREVLRAHPERGADLVGRVSALAEVQELVRCHHERFDGAGYPRGLRGEAIPVGARLFAVADAFDAMTTDRPYRPALAFDEARRRIEEGAGTQFDPRVAEAFRAVPFAEWRDAAGRHGVVLREGDDQGSRLRSNRSVVRQ